MEVGVGPMMYVPDEEWDNDTTFVTTLEPFNTSQLNVSVQDTPHPYFYQKEQVIFLWVLFAFIIVGNSAVLVAIAKSRRGLRSRMNFFIMHLAIADLAVGLISVLTDVIWKITVQWYAGNIMCKVIRYLQAVVMYASTYVLVSLSIDRLDAIARPMNFTGSGNRAKIMVCISWLMSMVFSIPMLIINREKELINGDLQCWINLSELWHWRLYITVIAVVLFVIPTIIIAMCYIIIIHTIWDKSKLLAPVTKKQITKKKKVPTATLR